MLSRTGAMARGVSAVGGGPLGPEAIAVDVGPVDRQERADGPGDVRLAVAGAIGGEPAAMSPHGSSIHPIVNWQHDTDYGTRIHGHADVRVIRGHPCRAIHPTINNAICEQIRL